MKSATLLMMSLVCLPLLAGCAAPDRWAAGYSYQPASGALPERDTYSVGLSGPLSRREPPPALIARRNDEEDAP